MESNMKTFVVRLNPDLRKIKPYTKYANEEEYSKIQSKGAMNGFEECANFLNDKGIMRGYLPPKHSREMRNNEKFNLIVITAKTAQEKADQIVGVQFNCIYVGESQRVNPNRKQYLYWHYRCNSTDTIIFSRPIEGARNIILDNKRLNWVRNPTLELNPAEEKRIFDTIYKRISESDRNNIYNIKYSLILNHKDLEYVEEDEVDLGFEDLTKLRIHKKIERDQNFINKLKKMFKSELCEACGCDLKKKYGDLANGYKELHHLSPVSENKGNRIKREKKDFALLCPNCHRMIHRSEFVCDLEKFKQNIKNHS